MTREETTDIVSDYLRVDARKTLFESGRPGVDWTQGFMEQQKKLTICTAEQLSDVMHLLSSLRNLTQGGSV